MGVLTHITISITLTVWLSSLLVLIIDLRTSPKVVDHAYTKDLAKVMAGSIIPFVNVFYLISFFQYAVLVYNNIKDNGEDQ
ncbi:MAG: hypothetical protein HRT61_00260 [Ekhidna sp.]|jgi:hypothetical protein|nr:hypothetical protein [Ekhidna sp.]